MMRAQATVIALLSFLMLNATAARQRPVRGIGDTLIAERSFIVTDKAILEPFTFERVLDTLVARSGTPGLTSAQLYRQWFDTQNMKPGLADPAGPHCDDVVVDGIPMLNGYARRCPTPEGALAATPFTSGEYIPIELANRFDMTPPDGANCGQYRMVFARTSSKLHVIFEAALPNPHPEKKVEGCRPVARFWADLSNAPLAERRTRLETFFFDGLPGFEPVIAPDHYASPGGIRTLQTAHGLEMLQFRIARTCIGGTCSMRIVPDALENMPFSGFLDATDPSDRATRFREEFIRQIPNLANPDISRAFMDLPVEYLIGDPSPVAARTPPFMYDATFGRSQSVATADAYRSRVATALAQLGSTLTPENLVARAQVMNCVGCHFLAPNIGNGVTFPQALANGEQVTEDAMVDGEGGQRTRYAVSAPVSRLFVPNRIKVLEQFLSNGTPPSHSQ